MRVTRGVAVPLSEIELRVSRSSGPGGQHANVTASRVEAVLDVASSPSLGEEQRRRVMARVGPAADRRGAGHPQPGAQPRAGTGAAARAPRGGTVGAAGAAGDDPVARGAAQAGRVQAPAE